MNSCVSLEVWLETVEKRLDGGNLNRDGLTDDIIALLPSDEFYAWQSGLMPESVAHLTSALSKYGLFPAVYAGQVLLIPKDVHLDESGKFVDVVSSTISTLVARMRMHHQLLSNDDGPYDSDLSRLLMMIAKIADNQDVPGVAPKDVRHAVDLIVAFCFPSLGDSPATPPPAFWKTPLGIMLSQALFYVNKDELLTYKKAADLAEVSVQVISNAVRRGRLIPVPNPDASHPVKERFLVSKSDVEKLWPHQRS